MLEFQIFSSSQTNEMGIPLTKAEFREMSYLIECSVAQVENYSKQFYLNQSVKRLTNIGLQVLINIHRY